MVSESLNMLEGGGTRCVCIGFEGVGALEDGAIHFTECVAVIDDGVAQRACSKRVCCVCS